MGRFGRQAIERPPAPSRVSGVRSAEAPWYWSIVIEFFSTGFTSFHRIGAVGRPQCDVDGTTVVPAVRVNFSHLLPAAHNPTG